MVDASQTLTEAYELIEAGDLAAARTLLESIQDEQAQNPDYWWLYAHAVTDETAGREAVRRVLELDPDYPGAQALASQVGLSVTPATRRVQPLATAGTPPDVPDLPAADRTPSEFDAEYATDGEPAADEGSGGMLLILLSAAVIVVAIIGVIVVLPMLTGDDTPEATETGVAVISTEALPTEAAVVDMTEEVTEAVFETVEPLETPTTEVTEAVEVETDAPTETSTEEPTEEPTETSTASSTPTEEPTDEPTEDVATTEPEPTDESLPTVDAADVDITADLMSVMAEYDVPADGIIMGETSLGNTLIVQSCVPRGPRANAAINGIITTLLERPETVTEDVEGVAVSVVDCETGRVFNTIGAPRDSFDALAAGEITYQEFRDLLAPLG